MNVVKYSVVFFFHCSLFPVFLFFSVIMFCKYEAYMKASTVKMLFILKLLILLKRKRSLALIMYEAMKRWPGL